MHRLAWDTGRLLTDRWGTTLTTPEAMIGAMITVPLPERAGATAADAEALRLALLEDDKIEVAVSVNAGRLWARVSCQIYNDLDDITRLADAVARRLSR
jgi:isopenicillin-N epimerase